MGRVARKSSQAISNRQAYDALYPRQQSWYDEKKFVVLDKNFQDIETNLLGKFKQAINKEFGFTEAKKTFNIDEMDISKVNLKNMNFEALQKIRTETVQPKSKYVDNYTTDQNQVISSNPYNEIFGNAQASK